MSMKRRDFLKAAGVLGTGAVFDTFGGDLQKIFAQVTDGSKHVIWLQGSSDSGCSISLLQGVGPDLVDVITNFRLAIDFHPMLMIPSGQEAISVLGRARDAAAPLDVLVVEGAIPTGYFCSVGESAGKLTPVEYWVRALGARAANVVAVGTCASFGGIPAAAPNPTGSRGVSSILGSGRVINVPGCPAHPDWIVLTLADVLSGIRPALDRNGRPSAFFEEDVHDECPLEDFYEDERFAASPGQTGCLFRLGCRGPITRGDCPQRLWNNRTSFCISGPRANGVELYRAGAPCIGCTEPGFPDPPFSPFYERGPEED